MQKEIPEALLRLTLHSAASARSGGLHVAVHLSGQEGLWERWMLGEQSLGLLPIRIFLGPLSGLTPVSSCGSMAAEHS